VLQAGDPGGPDPHSGDDGEERANAAAELGIIRGGGVRPLIPYERGGRAMKFMSMEDETATFEAVLFRAPTSSSRR